MSAFRSEPGLQRAGWRVWAMATALIWLGPVVLGLVLLALAYALGAGMDATGGHGALGTVYITGFIFFFSPILSWIGLLVALPAAAWLMSHGLGGWASFTLLGLVVGLVAGLGLGGGYVFLAPLFGALAALIFRRTFFTLAR